MRVPEGPIPLSSVVCTVQRWRVRREGHCWEETNQSNPAPSSSPSSSPFIISAVKLGSQSTPPQASRPGLTLFGLSSITVASILNLSKRLLFDPNCFWALASLVVVADVALTQLIIRFVPCMISSPPAVSHPLTRHTFQIPKLTGKLICTRSKSI